MGHVLLSESKVTCTSDEDGTNSKIDNVRADMKDAGDGLDDRLLRCRTVTTGTR